MKYKCPICARESETKQENLIIKVCPGCLEPMKKINESKKEGI